MLSSTSHLFSNDTRATEFRREIRNRVARRQECAVPGSGASAQEVQAAYLRYCALQQAQQGHSESAQEDLPAYMPRDQGPPPYTPSDDQDPPGYASTTNAAMTPTEQLDILLYSNPSTPPSPPGYSEAIASSPSSPPKLFLVKT
ncbi:hypothetical protein QM012_002975 [Aureobasidium pullulans]|uniref:Uncharacterized protein n=1 Tax=Aureobasidium pullulans TaxID=5580 RepID=A0ABR0T9T7_AURPU